MSKTKQEESYSTLILNNKDVCYYVIENEICFLKVLVILEGKTERQCENFYAYQISKSYPPDTFRYLSYLNV